MQAAAPAPPPGRLTSIDAYRGLVMFLMMAELLRIGRVAQSFPGSGFWQLLAFHTDHVPWTGCSLHDLIQPSFSFLVGVSLPFSIASRTAKGETVPRLFAHALWRSFLLIALGIFLRSVGKPQTYFTFEDTLTQIGLGYPFLFLLGAARSLKTASIATAVVLMGYWLAFALYPAPGPGFDFTKAGVPADWPHHFTGFLAHWDKNSNLAWAFDTWFLNLFPRQQPFAFNSGGYATLSFIPTLGTMLLGLIAGMWLRADLTPTARMKRFALAGVIGLASGLLLQALGICPVVKRIWTPAWTLFSGGWCFLFLAGFYWLAEIRNWRAWTFPLVVIGANSITIYCLVHLISGFIQDTFKTHLGPDFFKVFGMAYQPLLSGAAALSVFWLILYWMYRRKLFLKL